ncbi:MAG TPA: GMC family oxidoreductase N-terminal domain-containing protein, partial [Longimicrobiales bacterium]|nr:GMC family oxidoreductase N-terminal domain-containing protein [Longimicrobiales bacterium]
MHTFESLARSKKDSLDKLMKTGRPPALEDVLGYEFAGWNLNASTKILGTRKFKKGFFGGPGLDHIFGYNVPVKQNGITEPWIAEPSDEDPKRYYFFKVYPARQSARYPNSLIVDYQASKEYFALNPVGYTVDYLVYVNPDDDDLILGKSYLEVGFLKPYLGYFVLKRNNPSNYGRDSHFLNERELRTVEAFAEVFIEGQTEALSPREVAFNIDRHLARIRSNRTQSVKLALFVVESLLPRRSWWPFRRPFSKMSVAERKQFLEKALATEKNKGLLRDLPRIRALFAAGYYMDERTYPGIHFETVEQRPVRKDHLNVIAPPVIPLADPGDVLDCDVCVIGSGAGGAIVACKAAEAGKSVVVLEEGPYFLPPDISNREAEMTARLYKEGGLSATMDLDMSLLQGKCLGGTTVINNAICFRLNDGGLTPGGRDVLAEWAALGAAIDGARLSAAYDRVEQAIGVRPLLDVQDPAVPPIDGPNAHALLNGWADVQRRDASLNRFKSGLFKKNYNQCLGCGYCNFGCRWGRKMSMAETYLPRAARHGARIVALCHAERITIENGRASAVVCKRADGRTLTVHAKSIVVSCGAVGSSVLLMKSGVKKNVGNRFSFNAGTPMYARFADPVRAFDGVQMAAYIDLEDYLLESLFYPPVAFAASLPGWFNTHFERMQEYDHFACAGVLIGTDHNGRVKGTSTLRNLFGPLDYKMTDADLARMRRGLAMLAHVFFKSGATTVLPTTFADVVLTRDEFGNATPDQI